MQAKKQALKDIKDDLRQSNKAFIAFRSELNPTMRRIVSEYLKEQKALKAICLSCWKVNIEEE